MNTSDKPDMIIGKLKFDKVISFGLGTFYVVRLAKQDCLKPFDLISEKQYRDIVHTEVEAKFKKG